MEPDRKAGRLQREKEGCAIRSGKRKDLSTKDIVYTGMFVVLITICSWISIPASVPMQTFAVFMTVLVLGGKNGTLAVIVYILLGTAGAPVFAGFTAGFGVVLGSAGGYLVGFILTALIMWAMETSGRKRPWIRILSMIFGLLACYTVGTGWFMAVYQKNNGAISLMTALGWCVFPFVIPDLVKIGMAYAVSSLVTKQLRLIGQG